MEEEEEDEEEEDDDDAEEEEVEEKEEEEEAIVEAAGESETEDFITVGLDTSLDSEGAAAAAFTSVNSRRVVFV